MGSMNEQTEFTPAGTKRKYRNEDERDRTCPTIIDDTNISCMSGHRNPPPSEFGR